VTEDKLKNVSHYFSMLDYIHGGVCLLQKDYTVLFWNECLEDWTGISKGDIIGQEIDQFYPHLKEPKYRERFSTVFEGGPPAVFSSQFHKYVFPCFLSRKRLRIQHTTVEGIRLDDDNEIYAFIACQDVTDLTERIHAYRTMRDQAVEEVKERERAQQALQEAMKELESFSYSISHDLRAPLRAIQGFSEILAKEYSTSLDEVGQHFLNNVVEAGTQMNQLIDDLLAYCRISDGQEQGYIIPLQQLFEKIHRQISNQLHEQQGILELPGITPDIYVNESLLMQIIMNLITNGLRYHRKNIPPIVKVSCEIKNDFLLLRVNDNGIGISKEYHEKIFEVFQRLHANEEIQGTGIGLANVKKATTLLGGVLSLESTVGEGSEFFIQLPIQNKNKIDIMKNYV